MERTLVLIKPDGVRRGLTGEILRRFENRMLNLMALKMLKPSKELVERHYEMHRGKYFFDEVVASIASGTVVAMVLEGENAVTAVRQMMGDKEPICAAPGTIRGDYALSVRENIIHGSDSLDNAEREISIWFDDFLIAP